MFSNNDCFTRIVYFSSEPPQDLFPFDLMVDDLPDEKLRKIRAFQDKHGVDLVVKGHLTNNEVGDTVVSKNGYGPIFILRSQSNALYIERHTN